MSAILAALSSRIRLALVGLVVALLGALGLPDLDGLRELLRKIQEMLALGGVALATAISLVFVLAWVFSHLRRPRKQDESRHLLPLFALYSSYVPVGLTGVAAVGTFLPVLAPWILKAFATAVLVAALSWSLAVAALIVGGCRTDLSRARRALLLAGTPWYCLALYLSTFL
jgi:hypothetical protein